MTRDSLNNHSRKDRDLIHFVRSAQYGRHHRRNRGERSTKTNEIGNLELVLSCDIVDFFFSDNFSAKIESKTTIFTARQRDATDNIGKITEIVFRKSFVCCNYALHTM